LAATVTTSPMAAPMVDASSRAAIAFVRDLVGMLVLFSGVLDRCSCANVHAARTEHVNVFTHTRSRDDQNPETDR
jgi:hypothetical protein